MRARQRLLAVGVQKMNDERAGFHALMQRMDIGRQGSRRSDGSGVPPTWGSELGLSGIPTKALGPKIDGE